MARRKHTQDLLEVVSKEDGIITGRLSSVKNATRLANHVWKRKGKTTAKI